MSSSEQGGGERVKKDFLLNKAHGWVGGLRVCLEKNGKTQEQDDWMYEASRRYSTETRTRDVKGQRERMRLV